MSEVLNAAKRGFGYILGAMLAFGVVWEWGGRILYDTRD
jgi:hypothetical protein